MISKTITIHEKQADWIDEHSINLSSLVRRCISRHSLGATIADSEYIQLLKRITDVLHEEINDDAKLWSIANILDTEVYYPYGTDVQS